MNRNLLSAALGCGFAFPALAVSPTPSVQVDEVSQAAIQNAFQILRSEYIRSGDLTFDELNRAAFQGLLQRLDLGAQLVTRNTNAPPAVKPGLLAEKLTPEVGYLRPLALVESELPRFDSKLSEWRDAKVPHLILDLRSPAAPGDFATAAAILDFFLPPGQLLFRLKQVGREDAELFLANRDPIWKGEIVVLADGETNNLGETIAAALRQAKRAVVVGSPTRGATVRYQTVPIDADHLLQFAHAEMLLPDGTSLFKKGLQPDFAVDLKPADKRKVFDVVDDKQSVALKVFDRARLRYNEAALVARKNPELDAYIKRSAGQPMADDRAEVRDTVLQRAVDMLTARDHFGGMKIEWQSSRTNKRNGGNDNGEDEPLIRKAAPAEKP